MAPFNDIVMSFDAQMGYFLLWLISKVINVNADFVIYSNSLLILGLISANLIRENANNWQLIKFRLFSSSNSTVT